MFALFVLALTATSASVYENISGGMEQNHNVRTALSYISTKVRQAENIRVEDNVLLIADEGGTSMIYFHEGTIMEYYGEKDDDFEPTYGDEMVKAESFEAESRDGCVYVDITVNGRNHPLVFAEKTGEI